MLIIIKHRYYYYRRFEHDIWGLCFLDMKGAEITYEDYFLYKDIKKKKKFLIKNGKLIVNSAKSWLLRFFFRLYNLAEERRFQRLKRYIYRIDIITHVKRKKRFDKRFLSLRLTRLYFLSIKDHQFRFFFRRASKMDGNLESNYCLLLECRVMALFYRTNFLCNIFEIIKFVKDGNVFINMKRNKNINGTVSNNSFINCSPKAILRLRKNLITRLKNQIVLFFTPKFLFISYYFLFAYLSKPPMKKDFVYPFSLDIQRITGYN